MLNCMDDPTLERLMNHYDTYSLLLAVDALDDVRGWVGDTEEGGPPQVRHDLLRLHELALGVIHEGSYSKSEKMAELAMDLSLEIHQLLTRLEAVQEPLDRLLELIDGELPEKDEVDEQEEDEEQDHED